VKSSLDDELFLAPFFLVMHHALVRKGIPVRQDADRSALKGRLFFQSPADLPLESGNTTLARSRCPAASWLPGFLPKEVIRFQFSQLVEGIADVRKASTRCLSAENVPVCLYNAQLTFEGFTFFAYLLDLRVEWLQFQF
jgi:hypothetical protein